MPASPSTARAINDRLALRLLQQEGPLTAGQLKQLTGLSRPTVADLVERLGAAGLIAVVGEAGEQRRGPNAKVYGIVADRAHLAALDVRTEGVAVAVTDLVGRVLAEASVPIGGDTGTGPAVQQAVTLVERVAKEAGAGRLHTVGIGVPGLIDPSSGELRDSTGLPEWHRRLVATLQERLPEARVSVENETNLAALAEQRYGAARDRDTFVLLWLGQGTGAAVVLDGALRRGASGGTGEIGFLPVPGTTALPTSTDCEGGFHSLASAAAVVSLAAECDIAAPPRELTSAAGVVRAAVAVTRASDGGPGEEPAADDAEGAVRASGTGSSMLMPRGDAPTPGDAAPLLPGGAAPVPGAESRSPGAEAPPPPAPASAARFLDALADRLAVGVASVVAILDPGCVVLGGEVGQAGGEELASRVRDRIARMTPLPTEVRATTLGGGAVLRGALLTARDRAQEELFAPGGPPPQPSQGW
ncbi:ROK family transcriptional regulator [Streptomyces violaceochromogenes]|uniref:ROK family transcriptional regulator n=1 Tax=Streptomyces violaceochromogenes TaxID=67377 RepID=A0ABU6LT23_9ACTN|nr:ROK family transcriptional regulator [Streptomyces violaceochromogenes]MEC7052641.1 ROK family transcriptional regulator [Streptomyces violaceochromogenes]GHC84053.1 transcriptional regulator [Streptomyces violaceochromogenes]